MCVTKEPVDTARLQSKSMSELHDIDQQACSSHALQREAIIADYQQALSEHIGSDSVCESSTQQSECSRTSSRDEDDEEQHWMSYMNEVRALLLRGDRRAVKKLLGAYGGMGSFNDLVLGHRVVDGESVVRDDMAVLNDRLDGLRTSAWTQAKELAGDR